MNTSKHQVNLSDDVTFSDFIIYFHKLSHDNLNVRDVLFTMKRRSLVHHLCSNLHKHLIKNILNSKLIIDLDQLDGNEVSAIGLIIMNLEM